MYIEIISIFLLLIVTKSFGALNQSPDSCGYNACNLGKPDKLNVHVVMHTHDDVGWLKTVDQYFYGARKDIGHHGVQYILDSVIQSLVENPDRRFIYVEIAFFWRWWLQQSELIHQTVRQLVNEGRLEFISGGWCMNDEAGTHYNSIIDQHSLGAEFLRDQFGECGRPKVGWQIDPFGHSRELASLFAQMGFDGLFFGRLDYQDYNQRNRTKTMELIWKGSTNLGRQSWLFTGVLPNGYDPPSSFCYDFLCMDEPIMDDPKLHNYNVPERVQTFIKAAHDEARGFATNNIIMTMGSDFHYENANLWFKNMDKLIKYVNNQQFNGSDVNVFYSTPSCYLYALNKANRTWTSKTDDFFPYANSPHAVWTGYFTSRAALKRYERYSNNILQVARQLNALANINLRNNIFNLSEAMGIVQHHDAVSGTERQNVADDYVQRMSHGIDAALSVINNAYSQLFTKVNQSASIASQFLCQLSNISECLPIEHQDRFTLTLWNPTIHPVTNVVRVPVTNDYSIIDPTGQIVKADFLPISSTTINIPGRMSAAKNQLVFRAMLPALGFCTYYFQAKVKKEKISKVKMVHNEACTLQNEYIQVEFNNQGNLYRIINLQKNITVSFSVQGFYWYHSFPGNHSGNHFETSGAYVFRPLFPNAQPISTIRNITCIKSVAVQSAIIVFNDWVSQEVTVFNGVPIVELEWTIGPIPIDDNIGKEIILRYDTDIQTASKFYTDANGREILERIRDFRSTWNYTIFENVSGNYYPVNSRIWIKDRQKQLTILTDRSQGGASIHDGSIELMIHRRLVYSESTSLGEPLNETAFGKGLVVRGKHFLMIDAPNDSAILHRVEAQRLYMHPVATFALTNTSYDNYSTSYHQTWSALIDRMPLNVHLLTLDQLGSEQYLIRLEHFFELDEDSTYSKPVQVNLQELLDSQGKIINCIELALGANLPLTDMKRLNWVTSDNELSYWNITQPTLLDNTTITLVPMQIRTFHVTVQR